MTYTPLQLAAIRRKLDLDGPQPDRDTIRRLVAELQDARRSLHRLTQSDTEAMRQEIEETLRRRVYAVRESLTPRGALPERELTADAFKRFTDEIMAVVLGHIPNKSSDPTIRKAIAGLIENMREEEARLRAEVERDVRTVKREVPDWTEARQITTISARRIRVQELGTAAYRFARLAENILGPLPWSTNGCECSEDDCVCPEEGE